MSQETGRTLFVTGAGGHLGRRVVELLLESGTDRIVAGSRDPDKLSDLAAAGAVPRRADFDDPASLDEAFAGVDRLLIISVLDTPDEPLRRPRQHLAAIEAAVRAGVGHIVYTSMLNAAPDSPIAFVQDHLASEALIRRSGIPHTILRPSLYADIAMGWVPQVLASGKWVTAAGQGRTNYVWRDDLARTAAAALADTSGIGGHLDVTGPEALSPAEMARLIEETFAATIDLVPVTDAALAEGLRMAGLPDTMVELLVSLDMNARQGRVDASSDTVERLTGTPPRSFGAFLEENRAALLAARDAASF